MHKQAIYCHVIESEADLWNRSGPLDTLIRTPDIIGDRIRIKADPFPLFNFAMVKISFDTFSSLRFLRPLLCQNCLVSVNPQSPSFITSIAPRLSLGLLCEPLLLVYYSLVCVSPLCAAFANLRRACLCEPTVRRQRVLVVVSHWIPPSFLLLQFYDSLVCVSSLCAAREGWRWNPTGFLHFSKFMKFVRAPWSLTAQSIQIAV